MALTAEQKKEATIKIQLLLADNLKKKGRGGMKFGIDRHKVKGMGGVTDSFFKQSINKSQQRSPRVVVGKVDV